MEIKEALVVLIKFVRDKDFTKDTLDACVVVLKFAYEKLKERVWGEVPVVENLTPEQALEIALAEVEEPEAKGFTPGIWVTIGLFVLEVALKKIFK